MSRTPFPCRWAGGWATVLIIAALGNRVLAQEDLELPPLPPQSYSAPAASSETTLNPSVPSGSIAVPLDVDLDSGPRPNFLSRPLDSVPPPPPSELSESDSDPSGRRMGGPLLRYPFFPTSGFAGRSSVLPTEVQVTDDFVPIEDRWRIGYPYWDRYDRFNRIDDDYPYEPGNLLDPFNQNVLKGDYPILGQHTFLEITASTNGVYEGRSFPIGTTPFESTARPFQEQFFGRPNSFLFLQFFNISFDLTHGDAAFKQPDWRIRLTPVFNVNNLSLEERAIVSPNVLAGTTRTRTLWTLQEWFAEYKIGDTSPWYDFVSIRAGSQPFVSDFRGFLFFDTNSAIRLFGTRNANRDQFNLAVFRQMEKDVNSFLNEPFQWRDQNLFFMNYYRQDTFVPGYTMQLSLNYVNDNGGVKFDNNRFLVRPDPVGIFRPHAVNVGYFGWAGEGHFGRYNVSHQFYWAFGRDTNNPIANRPQTINGQFFAIEGSYDRDWIRFKTSFLWQSGDNDPNNNQATGFDTILDNPFFAGGQFSYLQRQAIPLFGIFLFQRNSLVANLRSSKVQGQPNFVNPGLLLGHAGMDIDLTPKLKMFNNASLVWFEHTAVLEQFLFDGNLHNFIGADLSVGFEYRPLVSENIVMFFGVATLLQGQGFRDLYNNLYDRADPFVQGFANLVLTY